MYAIRSYYDGFIWGSPVYYAHPTGRILSVLDRVFRAGGAALAYKPGAAIASARSRITSYNVCYTKLLRNCMVFQV